MTAHNITGESYLKSDTTTLVVFLLNLGKVIDYGHQILDGVFVYTLQVRMVRVNKKGFFGWPFLQKIGSKPRVELL